MAALWHKRGGTLSAVSDLKLLAGERCARCTTRAKGSDRSAEEMQRRLATAGGSFWLDIESPDEDDYRLLLGHAGDVANHLHPLFGRVRVEHYNNAEKMGRAVGRSIIGNEAPYGYVHSFWSDQYEHKLEYVGHAPSCDGFVVRGSVEGRKFVWPVHPRRNAHSRRWA